MPHVPADEPVEVARAVDEVLEHLAGFFRVDRAEAGDLGLGEVLLEDAARLEELRAVLEERHAHAPPEARHGRASARRGSGGRHGAGGALHEEREDGAVAVVGGTLIEEGESSFGGIQYDYGIIEYSEVNDWSC